MADGATPIGQQALTITVIAAELAKLQAQLEVYGSIVHMTPAEDEEWQRLFGRMRELEDMLVAARPRNAREALATAAVAFGKVRDTDEVGGVLHTEAFHLSARVLDWMEAEAGVTAAELGLACYAAGRDGAPVFGSDDAGTRSIMQMAYDAGYLAAVRRFTPGFYQFAKRELEGAHGFNPLTAAAEPEGFDFAAHDRAKLDGVQHDAEPLVVANEH